MTIIKELILDAIDDLLIDAESDADAVYRIECVRRARKLLRLLRDSDRFVTPKDIDDILRL